MVAIDKVMYELIYRISKPNWDDGEVPPQIIQLASETGEPGKVLDLGCGTGTHSIDLAQRGFAVTGIDVSPTAIRRAREKASRAGVNPEFIVGDVTRLDFLPGSFDIALDVGCLHGLNASGQERCARELTRLMKAGSVLLVWGMDPQHSGMSLTPNKMQRIFAPGFQLERVESVKLHRRPSKWYWLRRV
jgi:SAM-dependent methyltransferase